MPTITRVYDPANGFQDLLPPGTAAPFDGSIQATNNGLFHVYVKDMTAGRDVAKIQPGLTRTFPIIQDHQYQVQVMGDVSIDYTLIRG
jgi:hypothetical protein